MNASLPTYYLIYIGIIALNFPFGKGDLSEKATILASFSENFITNPTKAAILAQKRLRGAADEGRAPVCYPLLLQAVHPVQRHYGQ